MPMDGDKHGFVVDSIRKLLALNVSDKEVLGNLYDVGIQKEEALALLDEARNPSSKPAPANAPASGPSGAPQKAFSSAEGSESSAGLSVGDQIIKQLGLEEDKSLAQPAPVLPQKGPEQIRASEVDFGVLVKESKRPLPQEPQKPAPQEISSSVPSGFASAKSSRTFSSRPAALGPEPSASASANPSGQLSYAKQLEMELADTEKGLSEDNLPEEEEDLAEQIDEDESGASVGQRGVSASPAQEATFVRPFAANQKATQAFPESRIPPELGPVSGAELEEIWKKGIIVAVNAKMSEMKRIKEDIQGIIGDQVDAAISKELARFKTLLDSQKDLIISSNKEALEQKQREIEFIIDAKISELKQYNKELSSNLEAMRKIKGDQELSMQQVTSSLEDARKLKSQLIVEMNSELIKSKSSAQSFIDQANSHLAEIDARVNKTLELEKNVADGMLQQAEQKIESLAIQRADELIADLEVEVNRLKAIEKKLSPETIEQKIRVLDDFKRQFLSGMQENLAQINIAIQDLNTKDALAEQQLKEKTLAIDAKLEELTRFEKDFTRRLNALFKAT